MIGEEDVELQPGDLVRLNSGGPDMVVQHIGDDLVVVTWAGSSGVFPAPCLTLITRRALQ